MVQPTGSKEILSIKRVRKSQIGLKFTNSFSFDYDESVRIRSLTQPVPSK